MLRYKTETRPGLVALYDIRPGNGAGPFLQPWSPHGARLHDKGQLNFHTPFVLNTPSEGFPFKFCNGGGAQ